MLRHDYLAGCRHVLIPTRFMLFAKVSGFGSLSFGNFINSFPVLFLKIQIFVDGPVASFVEFTFSHI